MSQTPTTPFAIRDRCDRREDEMADKAEALRLAMAHLPGVPIADVLAAAREIEKYLAPLAAVPDPLVSGRDADRAKKYALVRSMVADRRSNKEIAAALGIAQTRIPPIKRKLGLHVGNYNLTPERRAFLRKQVNEMRRNVRNVRNAAT